MELFIVDNKAGILPKEKTVLDVFKDNINRAINNNEEISFYVAVGFFFFEGFQELYPLLRKLKEKNLLKEFKIVMGSETKRNTKEILESLKEDASVLDDDTLHFIKNLYDQKKFDFRIFSERGFHIKLYLFSFSKSGLEVWVGSANLTSGGLKENIEMIVPTGTTIDEKDLYKEFFDKIWEKSSDNIENLKVIDTIREAYTYEVVYLHPRDFIINLIKILSKEYLIKNISADFSYLAEFQNMSYYLCINKLNKYGGCILANSFGLGKTDVGCMIVRYYKEMGKGVLIIYPPVMEGHWKKTLQKVGLKENDVKWLSRGMIQKGNFNYEEYKGIDLIVVDEAHHFRISNPKSNRRENLENIIKINPNSHVLLITATPISTSLLDFTELLKLFVKGNYKERFESEGILHKMEEIDRNAKEKDISKETIDKLNDLIKTFSVRIEWPDLPIHFKEDLKRIANIDNIEPPDVYPVNYKYDDEIAIEIFDKVVPFLEKLNFEYTKLWEKEYKEDKNLIWWYKWRIYKRLESSITAFKISLENILEKNKFLLDFLKKVISKPEYTKNTNLFSRERLENIKNTFLSLSDSERKEILKRIEEDITLIGSMLQNIEQIKNLEERDEKIKKLFELLELKIFEKGNNKPTIIFSESRDTVIYIGKRLKKHGKFSFELAYGGEAPIDDETEEKFEEKDKEKIAKDFNEGKFDILVSTDVMGEGVNLPRADVVINFDLPYNPVKLIQRAGRAIRINNPKKITIYNFEPDIRIDKELELCDKLAARVENIISTIGLDFLIWAVKAGKLEEVSEKNRKRTTQLIREYRHMLASKHPEELGEKLPPTLSKEDKALREFIKYWGISEESVETRAKPYRKPIFTALQKQATTDYFIVFRYQDSIHTIDEISFSENKIETRLSKSELDRIKSLIKERCREMVKESLKTSYSKNRTTTQIEKIMEKENLKDIFRGIDVSILPRKDQEKILEILNGIEKLPPWKKENEITELKNILEKLKTSGYQKASKEPELLAVIKYA